MEERLIAEVKGHPCLFDKRVPSFRDKEFKERAWHKTAKATGASVKQCKQRWKSLRDRFVREATTLKAKPEDAEDNRNDWCYMEPMQFLKKHIAPKRRIAKLECNTDDQPSCSDSSPTPQNDSPLKSDFEWLDLQQEEFMEASKPTKVTKRQRLEEEAHERFSQLCGTIETVITTKPKLEQSQNSAFLAMLDEMLKKKPEEIQDRLKMEVLNHVHNSN